MRLVTSLALVLALAWAQAKAEEHRLRHDPFARPPLGGAPLEGASAPRAPARAAVRTPPPTTLKLSGVLVAGAHSLANVNGAMLRVGEWVEGYQLVEVRDRSAIVEKNNVRYTLELPSVGKGAPTAGAVGASK